MRTEITIAQPDDKSTHIRAIVRGDLALHIALRKDGRSLNEWAVSHVPTGRLIIVIRGMYGGRVAFRALQRLSFQAYDLPLMDRCNRVVKKLRKRGLTVLFPRSRFAFKPQEASQCTI